MSEMRDALNAAMDSTKADDDSQNFDETPQEIITDDPAPEVVADAEADPVGVNDPADPAPEVVADAEADPVGVNDPADLASDEPVAAASNDSIKAPIDWSPQERESWSKIPRNLQEKVMAREKQMSEMMQSTSEARKTHEGFEQLTQKYGAVLSGIAGNTTVEQAGNLFDTVAGLRMGSPIQKAQIIADMISNFGVDINTLDSAIVGQAPSADQQESSRVEQLVAERMAPFEKLMNQQNAYADQQATQVQDAANAEVQQFAEKAEFINDVRHDMADLLDMADKRGQTMSMQQAYDKACMLNPEIQKVLNDRTQRKQLLDSQNTIASKKNAASSVNGRQVGNGGGSGALSMRDTISQAWDNQGKV